MSVDQIQDNFDDPELEQAFRQAEAESHTLDPAKVVAGGRRRRFRHRVLAAGSAALATAAVTAVALVADSLGQAAEPPVSQQSVMQAAPEPETIPNDKWVKVSKNQWFKFSDGVGRLSNGPIDFMGDDVTNYPPAQRAQVLERWRQQKARVEEARKEGWVGPDLGSGTAGTQKAGASAEGTTVRSSLYIGADVRRVVVSVSGDYGDFRYDARVFRLAGLPGWVFATAEFPPPSPIHPIYSAVDSMRVKVDAYGADGQRILRCGYTPVPDEPAAAKVWKACEKA